MLLKTLQDIFRRDLNRLKKEIEQYQDEEMMWTIEKNIANSAGNLCLHLAGNLQTYIGVQLGNTGYIRDRPFEFAGKHVPKEELFKSIAETIEVVTKVLGDLTEEDLNKEFPIKVFEEKTSTEFMLVHVAAHFSYHLGQINYHRRLLDKPNV